MAKKAAFQKRFYRHSVRPQGLYACVARLQETDVQVLTDTPVSKDFIVKRIKKYRREIENYISRHPRFLTSLKPIPVEINAQPIIKKMAQAAQKANVGPMAAVAGAIAFFLGKDLMRRKCRDVIIENGGDIFVKTSRARIVGIYSGRSSLFNGIKLRIRPRMRISGVCASSGTIGHSLSFGKADSAVILAVDPVIADAVATATCNLVRKKEDLKKAIDFAKSIKAVKGAVLIMGDNLASWGKAELVL
ncbi:MAG: UPF0280 family protein [Candidatus Omnitrophica bacterium]|jgi:hypothetical protein|nr:UPF0280 family protein [Candidatus Omnitrophota bacterium]